MSKLLHCTPISVGRALALCACVASFSACASAQPHNIALGKTVTFSVPPNYRDTLDAEDALQITDGKYSSQGQLAEVEGTTAIWVQKGTVGWQNTSPVTITIDLGSVQPISGVSYSTAAGHGGVQWPVAVYMATSEDNATWQYAGDLALLSRKNGISPTTGYHLHSYLAKNLKTKARYIAFGAVAVPFVFVDEIEVYAGNDAWLAQPATGRRITSMKDLVKELAVTTHAQRRINSDISDIREQVLKTAMPAPRRDGFKERLELFEGVTADMPPLAADFKAIVPFDDNHRDLLAMNGELMAVQGHKPLTVWKQHRYAWLPLLARPNTRSETRLHFPMLRNQFRSDNLLLTNATTKPQKVSLQLTGTPKNARDGWLQIDSVVWTDTAQGTAVADALLPITPRNGAYEIEIPAGMTHKLWLTVDSSRLESGSYKSAMVVNAPGGKTEVPLSLEISRIAMGKPRFSTGMWDETHEKGSYALDPPNIPAAIARMRSHFVESTWSSYTLPWPKADDFDAAGNFKQKPDFSRFDEWVARWPGAKNYFVFVNIKERREEFAGAKIDSPEFSSRLTSWARACRDHMKELGLRPGQLALLLIDEPGSQAVAPVLAKWNRTIKIAAPELTLFLDPAWVRPDMLKDQDAMVANDIICPNLPRYYEGGEEVKQYYADLVKQGKELWFYQASGPVRLYDPQLYYRFQPWHVFSIGGKGQGYWSFGDTGGAPTSWNEYTAPGMNFAPVFIDKDAVHNSVHWDAMREGVEDYEELAMLKDAIAASKNPALKAQAQRTLDEAVKAITGTYKYESGMYNWWNDRVSPDLADEQLQKVRAMLTKLAG